jgi:hypothetical protein
MNLIRGLQAFVRIFCDEMRAKRKGTGAPEAMERSLGANRAVDRGGLHEERDRLSWGIRGRIAKAMSATGVVLMIGCYCAAISGVALLAIYYGWILLTEGREGLTEQIFSRTPLLGVSGKLVGIGWILVFIVGWVLAWVGGRISKHPGDRLHFPWRSLLDTVRVLGPPFGLYFVFLWLILHLGVDQAILGGFLLLGASLMLVEKNQFPGLADRKSEVFVKKRDISSSQEWFCGECNKYFYLTHWLVQADYLQLPGYVAQCPECKGGEHSALSARTRPPPRRQMRTSGGEMQSVRGSPFQSGMPSFCETER